MLRYLPILLFIGLAWGQNPCEDERYLNIKKKSLNEMSEREYKYFLEIDKKCKDHRSPKLKYSSSKEERSYEDIKREIDELSSLPDDEEVMKILGVTLLIIVVYVLFIRDPNADVGTGYADYGGYYYGDDY